MKFLKVKKDCKIRFGDKLNIRLITKYLYTSQLNRECSYVNLSSWTKISLL